jgi:hypothetical protein
LKRGLTTSYEIDTEGITVPYPPLFDNIRRNHGFKDVRGRPDQAAQIPEGAESVALRALLVALAAPESHVFTAGCDLGTSEFECTDSSQLQLAGGYVQVMSKSFVNRSSDDYYYFAKAIEAYMRRAIGRATWRLRFVMMPSRVLLDGATGIEPSLWIWFDAAARSAQLARLSREVLIEKLRLALSNPELLTELAV